MKTAPGLFYFLFFVGFGVTELTIYLRTGCVGSTATHDVVCGPESGWFVGLIEFVCLLSVVASVRSYLAYIRFSKKN